MLDVEVLGAERVPDAPSAEHIRHLCELAADSAGVVRGHLAIDFVDGERIRELNRQYRGLDEPTDVLSFPIDGVADAAPRAHASAELTVELGSQTVSVELASQEVPVELGDVIISAEHTRDLSEAIVHGVLHLLGMDHERDRGEMLALQAQLLARAARSARAARAARSAREGP